MFEGKLRDFVEKNMPEEVFLSVKKIRALARNSEVIEFVRRPQCHPKLKNNWVTKPSLVTFGDQLPSGRWSYSTVEFSQVGATVIWTPETRGKVLLYSPWLKGFDLGSSLGTVPISIREEILREAGIFPVEVELPEEVVEFPRAPWDRSYPYDYGSGMVYDTEVLFVSEARDRVRAHVQELLELVGLPEYNPEWTARLLSAWNAETGGWPVP